MNFIIRCLTAIAFITLSNLAQAEPLGQFMATTTLGAEKLQGNFIYAEDSQHYTINNPSGLGFTSDEQFHYAYNQQAGDFILRAKIAFGQSATNTRRKVGFALRENLAATSPGIQAVVDTSGLTTLEFRERESGPWQHYRLPVSAPDILQIERRGDTFIFSAAKQGEPFQVTSVSQVKMGPTIYAGLSYFPAQTDASVTFSNVRIILPAAPNFRPYQDYIGSNLEILDMRTGNSRIIFRSPDSIQAPNWTRDGKFLIYNSKGLLYKYDLKRGNSQVLNTGFATANNNDHVLSWNGQQIGISHHAVDDNKRSTLYTLPLTGSHKPTQINAKGAGRSYLHGFSPDDKQLIFTGERNNEYNIFTIDLRTKKETQLTFTRTLDDGAEYTPDGKTIYFNSNRTGLMQLWRMQADGSDQQQVTFDNYNNWFPHISPDGKKLVFLSFMTDIDPGDHPFYRQVYLREMPISGGQASIIAYVYGGQGTINVPSWSPDGASIAFVSNTRQ